MPKVQEIIKETKKVRGRMGLFRMTVIGGEPTINGTCCTIGEVVDKFVGADVWRSSEALGVVGQVYPGHSLGVFRTRGRAGVIVDFTDIDGGPVVAGVDDVTRDEDVARRLREVTGYPGWRKQKVVRK